MLNIEYRLWTIPTFILSFIFTLSLQNAHASKRTIEEEKESTAFFFLRDSVQNNSDWKKGRFVEMPINTVFGTKTNLESKNINVQSERSNSLEPFEKEILIRTSTNLNLLLSMALEGDEHANQYLAYTYERGLLGHVFNEDAENYYNKAKALGGMGSYSDLGDVCLKIGANIERKHGKNGFALNIYRLALSYFFQGFLKRDFECAITIGNMHLDGLVYETKHGFRAPFDFPLSAPEHKNLDKPITSSDRIMAAEYYLKAFLFNEKKFRDLVKKNPLYFSYLQDAYPHMDDFHADLFVRLCNQLKLESPRATATISAPKFVGV